jgi:protein regulator of cytokinesis 1
MSRRVSYISTQLGSVARRLETLFDELGLSNKEREVRERQVYAVIRDALERHVDDVTQERDTILGECHELQDNLVCMVRALRDVDCATLLGDGMDLLQTEITPPYVGVHSALKSFHAQIEDLFNERLIQVNKHYEKLKDLASKVDAMSVPDTLLLTQNGDLDSLDVSNEHIVKLEQEVQRWHKEYSSRVEQAAQFASKIVGLWAELGTQQIDRELLSCYKTQPEKLGTLEADIKRLCVMWETLQQEKDSRVKRLSGYKKTVTHLWTKLSELPEYCQRFEKENIGIGESVLHAYQKELDRLKEEKRKHIHVFIKDSRDILQSLWDKLYFSEEETLAFTPAWTDIYTDPSLDAHETEIARLETLLEERNPILSIIESYKEIQKDQQALEASTHDSSRLLSKGPGRREPGRLLKEEQMRKRIAKRKPKLLQELKSALICWEQRSGSSFNVNGRRFLDVLADEEAKLVVPRPTPRRPTGHQETKPLTISRSASASSRSRSPVKTMANAASSSIRRVGDGNLMMPPKQPNFQPVRRPVSRLNEQEQSGNGSPTRGRHLVKPKPVRSTGKENHIASAMTSYPDLRLVQSNDGGIIPERQTQSSMQFYGKPRVVSAAGSTTSSENWETYDEGSSSEDEVDDSKYAKWRQDALNKLANDAKQDGTRLSEFNWEKDTF